jgi:hypothetical protein
MNTEREHQPHHELVAKAIASVERELPEVWSRVANHELGKSVISDRTEYFDLWRPITTLLYHAEFCEKNVSKLADLTAEMRSELRRRLGLLG